ncbi:MAG: YcgN family cysteine cluster protein [Anaerolineaceae bacterium]|nr:YcgN family cysteine cluster protein [Anaerolineaceae bacterium]
MIYHIAQLHDWKDAVSDHIYICDSLENEGFIHCSNEHQILQVANSYFHGRLDVIILAIKEDELHAPLKYEKAVDVDEQFPHIYGPVNMIAIKRVVPFKPQPDGSFTNLPLKLTEKYFWQEKSFLELTKPEWESLCDGCAKCCLYKIQDIDTNELFYTNVACKFLDSRTCQCTDYPNRHEIMPSCILLSPDVVDEIDWMPSTCAYRLLSEGKDLAWWHPLVSEDKNTTRKFGFSIYKQYIPEQEADMDKLEKYVVEGFDTRQC